MWLARCVRVLMWMAVFCGNSGVCWAQAPTDLKSTALSWTPQDASFFATSLDMRRSWEQFLRGNFVGSLRRVPYVQSLEQFVGEQWNNPEGPALQAKQALNNPNVRNLLSLAADMWSQEFFVYGGDDWCDTIDGLVAFQSEMTAALQLGPEAVKEFFDDMQRADIDAIRIPTTVIGFRLSDDENVRTQLDQLEGILRFVGGQQLELAPFVDKLTRRDFRDGQALTLSLDTSLIPMEQLEEEQIEVAERAIELLEGRSLSLSLGVKANVLVIAIGEGEDLLADLGNPTSSLLEHETLETLKQSELSELRSIMFTSQRWRESQWQANFANYFSNLSAQFSLALQVDEDIPDAEEWLAEIEEDAAWLDEKLSELAPEFGDSLAWSRAIPGGMEGWSYDWSANIFLQNDSPLEILRHAGARPLLLLAFKNSELEMLDEIVDYALERTPNHAVRFINAAEEDEEERAMALKVFERAWPLLVEFVNICQEQISPALDVNTSLFALSANWTTQELGPSLPPAEEAVPLPELAWALGLSDREQFIEGCTELYEVFDRVVELVRELSPDAIPADYQVPRPLAETIDGATVYSYAELTQAVELEGFKPQLSVGEDAIVLGFSDSQVRDMLEHKSLSTRPAWLAEDTPVAAVSYVDYAGLFAAFRPWLKYGLSLSGMPLDEPLTQAPAPVPSGRDLLQIWDCFSSAGIAAGTTTVAEDGPTVTRWVWVGR